MGQSLLVPNKLEASNFEDLRFQMLATNIRKGGRVLYDIHPPVSPKSKWYAFYTEEMDTKELLSKQLKQIAGK